MIESNDMITGFHLYTGNHSTCQGIEEFASILTDLMARNDLAFSVGQSLCPLSTNIVIDEFSNVQCVEELSRFRRQYPKTPVVFLLTEFFHQKYGVTSFNNFGGLHEQSLIVVFDLWCKWKAWLRNRSRAMEDLHSHDDAQPASSSLIVRGLKKCVRLWKESPLFTKSLHRSYYLHRRYLGLIENIHLADAVLVSHPAIATQVNERYPTVPVLGCLYPEFGDFSFSDDAFRSLDNYIEVTGSVTPYRQKMINHVNAELTMLGMRSNIRGCFDQGFDAKSRQKYRGAFSLHTPQSATWPYASPTRIFRAIAKDHNVPIISHHFDQHPIEDCALRLEGSNTYAVLRNLYQAKQSPATILNPKIRAYEKLAMQANQACVNALAQLGCSASAAKADAFAPALA